MDQNRQVAGCKNHLHQMGVALENILDGHSSTFPIAALRLCGFALLWHPP
jgi:hypothetical protein